MLIKSKSPASLSAQDFNHENPTILLLLNFALYNIENAHNAQTVA